MLSFIEPISSKGHLWAPQQLEGFGGIHYFCVSVTFMLLATGSGMSAAPDNYPQPQSVPLALVSFGSSWRRCHLRLQIIGKSLCSHSMIFSLLSLACLVCLQVCHSYTSQHTTLFLVTSSDVRRPFHFSSWIICSFYHLLEFSVNEDIYVLISCPSIFILNLLCFRDLSPTIYFYYFNDDLFWYMK